MEAAMAGLKALAVKVEVSWVAAAKVESMAATLSAARGVATAAAGRTALSRPQTAGSRPCSCRSST